MEVRFRVLPVTPSISELRSNSGNGLVSYYINLVLEGVGITLASTKAAINGGLQVRSSIETRMLIAV